MLDVCPKCNSDDIISWPEGDYLFCECSDCSAEWITHVECDDEL